MSQILIAEDDPAIREGLEAALQSDGHETRTAANGVEAMARIAERRPDLLLLDVMMPGMSGFELAMRLKEDEQARHIPIIFLTAKDTEDDTLHGFALGADDYVTKPFSVREVMARVKAVLSRRKPAPAPTAGQDDAKCQGLTINTANKTVCIDGNSIGLTRTEYELMKLLLEHSGQVFSRQQLLDSVWPQDVIVTERTVDVNIARLRKKLDRYAACLVSRTGFGYCFEEEIEK